MKLILRKKMGTNWDRNAGDCFTLMGSAKPPRINSFALKAGFGRLFDDGSEVQTDQNGLSPSARRLQIKWLINIKISWFYTLSKSSIADRYATLKETTSFKNRILVDSPAGKLPYMERFAVATAASQIISAHNPKSKFL